MRDKSNLFKKIILFVIFTLLFSSQVMAETGIALPILNDGEGLLKSRVDSIADFSIVSSTNTMGEGGVSLPVVNDGEGLLESRVDSSADFPIVSSTNTIGEGGVSLPVINKGEEFSVLGKKIIKSCPFMSFAKQD